MPSRCYSLVESIPVFPLFQVQTPHSEGVSGTADSSAGLGSWKWNEKQHTLQLPHLADKANGVEGLH